MILPCSGLPVTVFCWTDLDLPLARSPSLARLGDPEMRNILGFRLDQARVEPRRKGDVLDKDLGLSEHPPPSLLSVLFCCLPVGVENWTSGDAINKSTHYTKLAGEGRFQTETWPCEENRQMTIPFAGITVDCLFRKSSVVRGRMDTACGALHYPLRERWKSLVGNELLLDIQPVVKGVAREPALR